MTNDECCVAFSRDAESALADEAERVIDKWRMTAKALRHVTTVLTILKQMKPGLRPRGPAA